MFSKQAFIESAIILSLAGHNYDHETMTYKMSRIYQGIVEYIILVTL